MLYQDLAKKYFTEGSVGDMMTNRRYELRHQTRCEKHDPNNL